MQAKRGSTTAAVIISTLGAFLLLLWVCAPAGAATITVNSAADTTADDGACTLREAITAANDNVASGAMASECAAGEAAPTIDEIGFSSALTIQPATDLPGITEPATISGAGAGGEVVVDGQDSTSVGLSVEADDVTVERLTVIRFGSWGVAVKESDGVMVLDNRLGTNQANATGLGSNFNINLNSVAENTTIDGNVIANGSRGINLSNDDVSGTVITSNRIGTNLAGDTAIANGVGVYVGFGGDDIQIGGLGPGEGNLISGNTSQAITATVGGDGTTTGLQVLGNRIGTTGSGEAALPNATASNGIAAIQFTGGIQGPEVRGNLISGNDGYGIAVDEGNPEMGLPGPSDIVVAGNLIGTDGDGETLLTNGNSPVRIDIGSDHPGSNNTIGGTSGLTPGGACTGDCNVIAADESLSGPASAIQLVGEGVLATSILGNHIGIDAAGQVDLPAGRNQAISISSASGTTVGSPAGPNVIHSAQNAIQTSSPSGPVTVQSNLIGTRADGTDGGFTLNGPAIEIDETDGAMIGGTGPGEGNLIANTGNFQGIAVDPDSDNVAMLGNSIRGTAGLAIDLGDNDVVDENDTGVQDADMGSNGLQNFPDLDLAVAGGSTYVGGTLDSLASTDFRLEFFSTGDPDLVLGHGDPTLFLGSVEVTTDAAGLAEFFAVFNEVPDDAGDAVMATATELDGSGNPLRTSEISDNLTEGSGCDPSPTEGDDVLCGTSGADLGTIDGLGGNDLILGLGGDDTIDGGSGDDTIFGDNGSDSLTGGAGEDDLSGGGSPDTLQLQDGEADTAGCGDDNDTVFADLVDTVDGDCETVNLPDVTAPETTIDTGPGEGETIATDTAEFGFSSNESPVTFECSVDSGPFEPCTSPQELTGLAEGAHSFEVQATDAALNTDATPAKRNFTVAIPDPPDPPDTTAPELTASAKKTQTDKKKVKADIECDEDCTVVATGTIKVPKDQEREEERDQEVRPPGDEQVDRRGQGEEAQGQVRLQDQEEGQEGPEDQEVEGQALPRRDRRCRQLREEAEAEDQRVQEEVGASP